MRTPASEVIRKTALKLLAEYPNGRSLADLKFLTESKLKQLIAPDNPKNGKYRSALWDLEKRFPEYVQKNNNGRAAIFIPTVKLQNDKDQILVPAYSPTAKELFTEKNSLKNNNYIDYLEIKAKITDVINLIENIDLNKIDVRHLRNPKEALDIIKAVVHLEGLKELKYSIQNVQQEDQY